MSWLFSRALVEEYSGDTSPGGEQFAQLNVTPTAQPFWRNDKPMESSRFSRFGLTFRRLTDDLGEDLLTWFRRDFLAKTSVPLARETDSTAPVAVSGARLDASFAKYDQEASKWRTHQSSLLGGYTEFSETWPRWGLMRNGECWERPTSGLPTFERESGLLPTPVTVDAGSRFNRSASAGAALSPTLGAMARFNLWPTPTCGGGGQTLPEGTTPTGKTPDGRKHTVCLERYVQQVERKAWPTPTVSMRKGSSGGALTRKTGKSRENDRLDYAIEGDASLGRLNPTWVEWLMGWPLGWTELRPLEMDRFLEWQQQHGKSSSE